MYKPNPGGTEMLTLDQLRERNVTADYVGLTLHTRATNLRKVWRFTEKAPTRAFSLVCTIAFTFKNLC